MLARLRRRVLGTLVQRGASAVASGYTYTIALPYRFDPTTGELLPRGFTTGYAMAIEIPAAKRVGDHDVGHLRWIVDGEEIAAAELK